MTTATWIMHTTQQSRARCVLLRLPERARMGWQVGPWCVPLPEGTRICHLRTNMGTDWADNVVPVLPELGAKPTDIVVRSLC